MALDKTIIPISFSQGIDTKSDEKQVVPGKLLSLENAKFQTAKELTKIPGDAPLSKTVLGSSSLISNAVQLATFKDELVLNDGAKLYSYGMDESAWSDKHETFTVSMDTTPVIRDNYAQVNQDSATHPSGLQVFAWEDSSGGVRYTVIDSATKMQIQSNQLIVSTGSRPKCLSLGNFLLIICYDSNGTRLIYRAVNVAASSTIGAIVEIATDVDATNSNYDTVIINSVAFFAYNNNSGGISYRSMDQFLSQSASHTEVGEVASATITIFGDASFNVWISYYNGADVKYFIVNNSLSAVLLSPTVIETVVNIRNITGVVSGTVGNFFYENSRMATYNHFLRKNTGTLSGTVGSPSTFLRSVGLGSKAFSYGANIFMLATYEGPLQPTYFLINQNGIVAAKISPLTGGGLTKKNLLPQINNISSGVYQISYLQQDFFAVTGGVNFFLTGVMQATLNLNPGNIIAVDIGNGLQSTGGYLSTYDGISSVELGYHVFPEKPDVNILNSTGGLSNGQYQWVTVYAWTDNYGQIHRSAPSIPQTAILQPATPVTFTSTFNSGDVAIVASSVAGLFVGQTLTDATTPASLSSGTYITDINGTTLTLSTPTTGASAGDTIQTTDVHKVTLDMPTLRVTAKKAPIRSNAWIEVYRTEADQDLFYLVSSITSPTYNNPDVDVVTFVDTTPDNAIIGNLQLYTTGGVLENISPPAAKIIWQYKTRLILVPFEDQNSWWYSKEVIPGTPLEFTDAFVNNMDQRGGPITAGIQMDGTNVFFKAPSDVFIVTGDGPAATGANNDFTQPQRVPTGAGCIDAKSVLLTPAGAFYRSMKGFYLLTRSFEARYIGADVEAFNSANVTSGQLILNDNEVRFTLSSGIMLMYDYYYNQWTTIPDVTAADSATFQTKFCYVQPDGLVLLEDPNIWTHNGNVRRIKLITSWLSLAGLQGFQRVYKMLVLGQYISPHKLRCSVAVNFNPAIIQEDYINTQSLLAGQVYGEGSPYGAPYESLYGGVDQTYQWRLHMKQQKCQTIQLTLEEIPIAPYGEGLSLSGITLEVGGKKGVFKVAANHSFG